VRSWEEVDLQPFGVEVADLIRGCPDDARLATGVPVLLDADFYPIEPWASFFRELAEAVGTSTLRNYGYDAKKIESFLRRRGLTVTAALQSDLVAYRKYRLETCPRPASPATYQRERVVVQLVYGHLVSRGVLQQLPWIKIGRKSPIQGPEPVPNLQIRCLSRDQWVAFRDVGLAGLLPGGEADPSFRGSCTVRNPAAADLGIGSGMRISEFTSVLDCEIPTFRANETATLDIQATAKYAKARTVDISLDARKSIDLYRRTERLRIVRRQAKMLEKKISRLYLIDRVDPIQLRVSGIFNGERQSWAISALPRQLRDIAVTDGEHGIEAMSLFLGESGLPPRPRTWSDVFHGASVRLNFFRGDDHLPTMPSKIVAHDLRHTYAVVVLRHLTMVASEMEAGRREGLLGHGSLSDHLIWNPLLRLQERMGHASLKTTMKYLTHIDDSSDIVRRAMETWSDPNMSYADYISEMFSRGRQS
jgi:site-specific recombinase XerD